jgi:NDP-sugar pyrophosphorylase family protein
MTAQALIFADRDGADLEPVSAGTLPALVPVGGRPVVQHCIEDLWEAGVRDALVVVTAGDTTVRRELGNGERFGLALRYLESSGQQWPGELLAMAGQSVESPLIVARGDVLRGRSAARLLEHARSTDASIVHAMDQSLQTGIAVLNRRCNGINQLDWTGLRRRDPIGDDPGIELGPTGFSLIDGPAAMYDACLGALDGNFAGLLIDGRRRPGSSLLVAPRASIARSVHSTGVSRIGRGTELHDGVELAGRVDVGGRCVIDNGAQLIDSVVMPGTYVGRGARLQNAVANGRWLYRRDLGTCQRIDDPLLLAGPVAAAA